MEDPSRVTGSETEIRAAYEKTFTFISGHINELVLAVRGGAKT